MANPPEDRSSATSPTTRETALPGVTVSLQSPDLQGSKVAITDDDGSYRFPVVPVGLYRIEFSLDTFQTVVRENVPVNIS